ncbi:MAG: tRNA (N(6)-L-threonylcarbamoyladenosine(37)-C(2))-methylthiotransferase MtaB, partial [Bacteroidota bacterium]
MQPTVAFHTLGCKLNFAETSTLARQLKEGGFKKVEFENTADLYVINTCSVTENADKECRQLVRKALSRNPDAFITIVGCYAQLKPEEISSMEGVDLVLGAHEKFNLIGFLGTLKKRTVAEVHSCEIESLDHFTASHSAGDRTRVFLKVQDGCDYTCSYCTIPMARGKSRSDTISSILTQARNLASTGTKEIVLTGVNIGDFGISQKDGTMKRVEDFHTLVRYLDDVDGIDRFRISSIEPNLLTDEIIRFVAASRRFVPHFHIPLQSGSDKILKKMRRRYLRDLYTDRVKTIKSIMPDACIGVDVIVGFPGEAEEDFADTLEFIQSLEISYLHVFTFSERDGTDAPRMANMVPHAIRKERNKRLRMLSMKKSHAFQMTQLGKEWPVLLENEMNDDLIYGHTPNYVKVGVPAKGLHPGMSVNTYLES